MSEQTNAPHSLTHQNTDVIVIGAGPAGLSFAFCLANSGLNITIIDQQPLSSIENPAVDGRDIAMNHLSVCILKELGVWQRFPQEAVHPLKDAKVRDGSSSYALHFERSDNSDAPLGYLVANHHIRRALSQQVKEHHNIQLLTEHSVENTNTYASNAVVDLAGPEGRSQIKGALVVAADSRFSTTRRMMGISAKMKDYGRVMIVCNMTHQRSNEHTAQEFFQYGRTCAVLPLGTNKSSIVITVPSSRSKELIDLSKSDFTQEVEQMLNQRLGKMTLVTERFPYPLVGVMSSHFVAQRFALIGDAAVGMHPVTAHGYNLGLRSADTLAQLIIKAHKANRDIASILLLRKYEMRHKLLSKPIYDGTNAIVQLYTDDNPIAKVTRKVALRAGNRFKPFKDLITQRLTQERVSRPS